MKLRLASARSGVMWMRWGVQAFWRQPIALAGLFFMFLGLVTLVSLLPWIGGIVALMLFPTCTLGLMLATREAMQGKFPMPRLLLAGLRGHAEVRRQLLLLGLLYALGFVAVLLLSALADGGEFARLYLLGGAMDVEQVQQPGFQAALWIAMIGYVPLSMLFWHAPALAFWDGVPAFKGLFFSLMTCLANWRAMLAYMAAWTALYAAIGLALMVLSLLLGSSGGVGLAVVPIMLMLTAMFFCSSYFTYRDSFEHHDLMA
jgi:hypothetical protein